jgi:chromosome partitioning protein
MTLGIAVIAGKGGVTKSTIARSLVVEFTQAEWNAKLFDMDIDQGTSIDWNKQRMLNGISPDVEVQGIGTNAQLKKHIESGIWDVVISDAPAYASKTTIEIASIVDLLILPTRYTADDLRTLVRLIYRLTDKGIDIKKLAVVFSDVSDKASERKRAVEYLRETGVHIIPGIIPHKDSFYQALDKGMALTETSFKSLKEKAKEVMENIAAHAISMQK